MSKVAVGRVTGTFPVDFSPGTGIADNEVIVIVGMWDFAKTLEFA